LYVCKAIFEGLAQALQNMAAKLREFIQEEHAVVGPRHFPRQRHLAAPYQAHIRDSLVRARKGRVVMHAVRAPVRPAM
jgi:hypothetical protein